MRGLIGNNEVFKSLKSGLMRTNALRMPPQKNVFEPRFYTLIPKDPYEANVVLHLKGDGAEGSTAIVDSSPLARSITRYGNTRISTAQSIYGGSSIYFDGSGDYLSIGATNDLVFDGQFTIEMWLWKINSGTYDTIFEFSYYNNGLLFRCSGTTGGWLYVNGNTPFTNFTDEIGFNRWTHCAISRDSSNLMRLFINGVLYGSPWSYASVLGNATYPNHIAMSTHTTGQHHQGYMDSFRVTKGVCRYTANFDPMDDFATYLNYYSEV